LTPCLSHRVTLPRSIGVSVEVGLLTDLQNTFRHPDGLFVPRYGGLSPGLHAIQEPLTRLRAAARDAGLPVIYTQHAYQPA
jgi:nicotinamidase-related amidase